MIAYLGEARGNATEAARIAGYATPAEQGYENLRKPQIRAAIDAFLADCTLRASEVLALLTEHARGSLADFIDVAGPIYILNLDKAKQANKLHLLKKLTATQHGVAIELHDPQAALEKLGTYHGLFRPRPEAPATGDTPRRILIPGADGRPKEGDAG